MAGMAVGLSLGAEPPCALWETGFTSAAVPHDMLGPSVPTVCEKTPLSAHISPIPLTRAFAFTGRKSLPTQVACRPAPLASLQPLLQCRLSPSPSESESACQLGAFTGRGHPVKSEKRWSG